MAGKKKKKPLTVVEKARKRDVRMIMLIFLTIIIPIILMVLKIGVPGKAFN